MIFYGNKMDVVRFATEMQLHFEKDSQLTTITRVGKSEVYSVSIVINSLSEDDVRERAQRFSLQPTITSKKNIRGTLFHKE